MKLQNIIKITLLLVFALSFTNCKDEACKTELKAVKQELADIENALDSEPKNLVTTLDFNFCETEEAISSGTYDTRIGIAHITIPIPVDNSFVSQSFNRKTNTVNYVFSGDVYGPNTKDYTGRAVTLTGLSRIVGSKLTIIVKFQYTEDECTELKNMTDKAKKSELQGAP